MLDFVSAQIAANNNRNQNMSDSRRIINEGDDRFESSVLAEHCSPPCEASILSPGPALTEEHLQDEISAGDRKADEAASSEEYDEADAARLAAVEIDMSEAQARISAAGNASSILTYDDAIDLQVLNDVKTAEELIAALQELFPEVHHIPGNTKRRAADSPPIVVTSGIAKSNEDPAQSGEIGIEEGAERRRRGPAIPKRVAKALLKQVENDPDYRAVITFREKQRLRFVAMINEAGPDAHRIASARDDFLASIALVEDYHRKRSVTAALRG